MKYDIIFALGIVAVLASRSQAAPISTNPADYAIVGESGVTLGDGFWNSPVVGDVYSAGNLTLGSNYGSLSGAGNMVTAGNMNVGSYSTVNGNINANGGVTVGYGAQLKGNVVYGTTYSNPSPVYPPTGTITQVPNSVPAISLPSAAVITSGTNDLTTSNVLTLAPGSYGNVTSNGLTLSSGDYYLKSFTIPYPNTGYLYLNITNAPIRVFVQGNISIGSYLYTYLNGQSSGTSSLASSVLWETGGNFNLAGVSISDLYGTVFTPSGSVSLGSGQMNGSIMSSGPVNVTTYQTVTKAAYNWSNLPVLLLAGSNATVITGGTANLAASVTNMAVSGASSLNYSLAGAVSSGSLTFLQSPSQNGNLLAQASQNFAVPASSTNLGLNTVTFTATGANTFNGPQTTTATLTVLDHAAPALSTTAASAGRVMRNALNVSGSSTLSDVSATYRAGAQIVSFSPGVSGLTPGSVIGNGGSTTVSGSLNTAATGKVSSGPYTIGLSDDQSLSGAISLPSLSFTATGTVLDNRQVTAPPSTDIGFVHVGGGTAAASLLLSTTGDDDHFTRATVANSTAADANGMRVSGGSTALRFGYDATSDLRTIGGTLGGSVPVGSFSGSLTLVAGAESAVTGTQSPINVVVKYTGKAYSGKAAWSNSGGGSWGGMTNWQDTQPGGPAGGSPGISGFSADTAAFGDSIGGGTANVTLDGQSPVLASLSFGTHLGGSYNISSGSGGQITISAGTSDSMITVNGGSHQISAPLVLTNNADFNVVNPQDSLTITSNFTGQNPFNKLGAGLLAITGTRSPSAATTINAGTLQGNASNVTNVTNNGTLIFSQPSDATYSAAMSGSGSFVKSGPGMLTLAAADNLATTGPISVQQGTLAAPLGIPHSGGGIQVMAGGTLAAADSVVRSVAGNGAVTATGDLFIGQSTQIQQFNQGGPPGVGGTLNVGGNAVVIASSDAAILGSQTTIGPGGSLTTLNGAQLGNPSSLDATKVLTAAGNATVNGNFINNGLVNGPTAAGQQLTFTQFVKGAGSTTGNILYDGSYSPGNSPAAVAVDNVAFGPNSTLILELQGTTPGSQYDQLRVSGLATLNGTLNMTLLGGFTPAAGETFDVFSGPTTGSFTQVNMPALSNGLSWDTSSLYTTGQVAVVPEPSTFVVFLTAGVLCLAIVGQKRHLLSLVKQGR